MVVTHRVHAAEQNGETGRTVSDEKYTRSPRTLRRGDVKDDERCVSHDREERKEQETPLQQWSHLCATISYTCIINGFCGLTIKVFTTWRKMENCSRESMFGIHNTIQK